MIRTNLHTHTPRCKHAEGTAAEYCRFAARMGLTRLGFSEHAPFPGNNFAPKTHPRFEELPDYRAELTQAARDFPALTVLAGLECEYVPSLGHNYFLELKEQYRLDYLIGSLHYILTDSQVISLHDHAPSPAELRWLVDATIDLIQCGHYLFIAHPDMMFMHQPWNAGFEAAAREIIAALKATGVPAEINGCGCHKPPVTDPDNTIRPPYPRREFWDIAAEYGIRVVVNADAHLPQNLLHLRDVESFAARYGLPVVNDDLLN
ncbi:MAG: hypothetical protein IJC73_00290 [Lentisphaeria bacterium]|nr:hypothetical protein [Lentisphaeria bacterium]